MSNSSSDTYNTTSVHHSFDINLACELGSTDLAILVHHFAHWIGINSRSERNFHEGKYWTYQTMNEILNHFPYWSLKHLKTLIEKLVKMGILLKGNFNSDKFNKTAWYTLSSECPKTANREARNGSSIYTYPKHTYPKSNNTHTNPSEPREKPQEKPNENGVCDEFFKFNQANVLVLTKLFKMSHHQAQSVLLQLSQDGRYSPKQINEKLKIAHKKKNITSLMGFMKKALEEDYLDV